MPDPERPAVSGSPTAPGEGLYVLFLGRVDVYLAGLDLLLAAVDLTRPRLPVILAGTGRRAERHKLVRLLSRTSGPVAWVGDVAAPARSSLLRECAFLVEPARSLSNGGSVLEAMAWGKPVVHFDLPGTRWMRNEAAIRVPAADVRALAAAITTLSTDDALRARMGHAARHVAGRRCAPCPQAIGVQLGTADSASGRDLPGLPGLEVCRMRASARVGQREAGPPGPGQGRCLVGVSLEFCDLRCALDVVVADV